MGRFAGSNPGDAGTSGLELSSPSSRTRRGNSPDPDSRHAGKGERFAAFAEAMHQELAPDGVLERVLAERVILSAWTLQAIAEGELAVIRTPDGECAGSRGGRSSPRGILQVALCLEKALDLLRRLRAGGPSRRSRPAPAATDASSDFELDFDAEDLVAPSNEWPVLSRGGETEGRPEGEAASAARRGEGELAERWQERLAFDFHVSGRSPVVKGTWITVSQVVSQIVDGWTWSDILRAHPELTEDDIRTCLAYTVAEDDGDL